MVQEQQGRVLGMLDTLSLSTQAALAGLEARLLVLEAKADACLPGGVTVYSPNQAQCLKQQDDPVMLSFDNAVTAHHARAGLSFALPWAPYSITALLAPSLVSITMYLNSGVASTA